MAQEINEMGGKINALVEGLVLVCRKKYGSWPFVDVRYLNPVLFEENKSRRQNVFYSGAATFYTTQDKAKLFLRDSGECVTIPCEVVNSIDSNRARNCFSRIDSIKSVFTVASVYANITSPEVINGLNSIEQLFRAYGRDEMCDRVVNAMQRKDYNNFARVWKLPFGYFYICEPQNDTPARHYLSRSDFKEVYQLLSAMKKE